MGCRKKLHHCIIDGKVKRKLRAVRSDTPFHALMDYFRTTKYKHWKRSDAIEAYEDAYPGKTYREVIGLMHKDLRALMQGFNKPAVITKAEEILKDKNKARRKNTTQATARNILNLSNANMTRSSNTFHLHGDSNVGQGSFQVVSTLNFLSSRYPAAPTHSHSNNNSQ